VLEEYYGGILYLWRSDLLTFIGIIELLLDPKTILTQRDLKHAKFEVEMEVEDYECLSLGMDSGLRSEKIVKRAVIDKMLKERRLLKPVKSGHGKLSKRRISWSVISTVTGGCKRYGS